MPCAFPEIFDLDRPPHRHAFHRVQERSWCTEGAAIERHDDIAAQDPWHPLHHDVEGASPQPCIGGWTPVFYIFHQEPQAERQRK